jgi:hypothetical protein
MLEIGFIFLRVWAVLDKVSGLSTFEATNGRTRKSRETSTRGTRLIGRSRDSSGTNENMLCWGPSSSEGPQKHDLTMFLKCNMCTGTFGLRMKQYTI